MKCKYCQNLTPLWIKWPDKINGIWPVCWDCHFVFGESVGWESKQMTEENMVTFLNGHIR